MSHDSFDLSGRVAVVTGGYGAIGGQIASALAASGARVAVLGRKAEAAERFSAGIESDGGSAMAVVADVLEQASLRAALSSVQSRWGAIDVLVNAAGGNVARARNLGPVFDVPLDAFDEVLRLNLHGTVLPALVFGEAMAARGSGSIVNVSSMAATQALSGVMGYSIAKAGIDNFTRWLAVDLARRYGDRLRVNAIAPGFFIGEQNRAMLTNPDGSPTPRGETIIKRTPMGRFGRTDELTGAVRFLCSDASAFITGVVIPIDGGFSAFSGV